MLVVLVALSSLPFTNTRPSASMLVPGQNMLCVVLVTFVPTGAVGFAGSNSTVKVRSCAPVLRHVHGCHDDHVSTVLFGSTAPVVGVDGRVYTWLQRPLASDCAGWAIASSVHRKLVEVVQVCCVSTAPLVLPGDRMQ